MLANFFQHSLSYKTKAEGKILANTKEIIGRILLTTLYQRQVQPSHLIALLFRRAFLSPAERAQTDAKGPQGQDDQDEEDEEGPAHH